ncbi:MAG TPA: PilZ domain-containing protein [Nitrospiraceae bacterium]|jgi:PilZ domain|nr:PilZ domain-containing protein [Nitrospiraceae bacterium]
MKLIKKSVRMDDGGEQRRGHRIPVYVPVLFEGEGRTGQGSTFNVSTWGCAVESHVPMPTGLYVGVSFSLPDHRAPLQVELAAVRWSRRNQFGMEFLSISKENRNRLEEFLAAKAIA